MKDASGASQMDADTQVTSLHGVSMLRGRAVSARGATCASRCCTSRAARTTRSWSTSPSAPSSTCTATRRWPRRRPRATPATRRTACSRRRRASSARVARTARAAPRERWSTLGTAAGLRDALDEDFDVDAMQRRCRDARVAHERRSLTQRPRRCSRVSRSAKRKSVFVRYLQSLDGHPSADAVLAAITTTLAWGPLMRKRVSRMTRRKPAVVDAPVRHADRRVGRRAASTSRDASAASRWTTVLGQTLADRGRLRRADRAQARCKPSCSDSRRSWACCSRTDPGAISAQGAKGAVSADGPETPERVQLNKAMVGFLTHAGYAHGGNGFEGVAFLLERFKDVGHDRSRRPGTRHRPEGDGRRIRACLWRGADTAQGDRRAAGDRRCPASTIRCSRASRSTSIRARCSYASASRRAANTTSSTTTTARWCRRCTTRT